MSVHDSNVNIFLTELQFIEIPSSSYLELNSFKVTFIRLMHSKLSGREIEEGREMGGGRERVG